MTKRRKKIAFSIIAIPFIIVALHFHFYFAFKKIIHADRSVNPIATNYFAHAMIIDMGTKLIHDYLFVDYDSLILKPLLSLENYFFEIGKKYVAHDNIAEEAAWWALLHADKYGIIKNRNDKSMYLSHMTNEESLAIRNQAYSYFLAIVDSRVKGIDLKDKEFTAVYALFVIPFRNIVQTYPGKTEKEKRFKYKLDYKEYQKEMVSYRKFKRYIINNPYYKNRYSTINSVIVSRLHVLMGFNYFNKNISAFCGQLLDDYLKILENPKTEPSIFRTVQLNNINTYLYGINEKCPQRRDNVLSLQKKFQ